MTIPLPPNKAELIVPSRAAAQNREIRRAQGVQLQTPRTYRASQEGVSIGNSTGPTVPVTLGTLSVHIQSGEMLALMCAVNCRRNANVNTAFDFTFHATGTPYGEVFLGQSTSDGQTNQQQGTFYSGVSGIASPNGSALNPGAGTILSGAWVMIGPHTETYSQTRYAPPAQPGTYNLTFTAKRQTGPSPLVFSSPYVWAMVF